MLLLKTAQRSLAIWTFDFEDGCGNGPAQGFALLGQLNASVLVLEVESLVLSLKGRFLFSIGMIRLYLENTLRLKLKLPFIIVSNSFISLIGYHIIILE